MRRVLATSLFAAVLLAAAPRPASAQSPFERRVHESIEQAVQFFRNQQGPDGAFGNREAQGLAVLCMLEKRAGADFFAPHVGYEGMDEDDQDRIRLAIRNIIDGDTAFNQGVNPYSYGSGNKLMALSLYSATGGEDDVGARVTTTQAIENGVRALQGTQGRNAGGCNDGGWNYRTPSANMDLSTTQFAAAGLAAAVAVDEDAALALERLPNAMDRNQAANGGHVYQSCGGQGPSHAMTASGIWCYRISGVAASDERVQRSLGWLQNNYQYDRQTNWWQNSFYYYLWAAAKGLATSVDDGLLGPDGIFEDDIGGVRNPDDDGFPEEPASWYYDMAYLLTSEQSAGGSWPTQRANGSNGRDVTADTGFACLVLERSLGGVCLDLDEDGLCEMEDNCPDRFNPDQQDTDFDGVGDNCDNCRLNPNIGQEDGDGDGQGDACDKHECTPTNDSIEICDGVDNDCNTHVDDIDGIGEICATGDPGVCAMGRMACVGGEVLCRSVHGGSRQEVCDLLDNDCDGLVDEDLRNDCGQCGGVELEDSCNGVDDDCDGFVDNGAVCPGEQACVFGQCAAQCAAGECPGGFACQDGYCVSPCADVECAIGQICAPATGNCVDPCEGRECGDGEVCVLGQCGSCLEVGCPGAQVCDGGACIPDVCAGVACARGEICKQGACVDSCSTLSCPLRQTCLDGRCTPDPCGGVVCFNGQTCIAGDCAEDPCVEGGAEACEAIGQLCHPGIEDCIRNPCAGVTCGEHERCEAVCPGADVDNCDARCVGDWLPGGAPIPQDFCDPDSPIYDEELCQGQQGADDGGDAGDDAGGDDAGGDDAGGDDGIVIPEGDGDDGGAGDDGGGLDGGDAGADGGAGAGDDGLQADDGGDAGGDQGGNDGGSSCFNSVSATSGSPAPSAVSRLMGLATRR